MERALRNGGIEVPLPQRIVHLQGGAAPDAAGARAERPGVMQP